MKLAIPISKGLFASLCLSASTTSVFAQPLVEFTEGFLAVERWLDMRASYDVNDLVLDPQFYEKSKVLEFQRTRALNLEKYAGGRMRGYITAPETGNYTFWVSAKASGQIWLSTDETPYRKNEHARQTHALEMPMQEKTEIYQASRL